MVLNRFRKRKKKKEGSKLPRDEFLKIKPVRNPKIKWEKTDKGISITIPLEEKEEPKNKTKKGFFSKLLQTTPKEKKIDLDNIGSIVWEFFDGEKTVKDIVDHLYTKYKLMPSEAEISLNAYFQELSKRGLIGLIFPKETHTRLKRAKELEDRK
jgi:hypothetical protein